MFLEVTTFVLNWIHASEANEYDQFSQPVHWKIIARLNKHKHKGVYIFTGKIFIKNWKPFTNFFNPADNTSY